MEHSRKNWLFSDTQAGAHASAGIYSIVTTARANGLRAFDYLEWVLSEMPEAEAVGELDVARFLPWSPDVPEHCRANRDETKAVFKDEPLINIDVAYYVFLGVVFRSSSVRQSCTDWREIFIDVDEYEEIVS